MTDLEKTIDFIIEIEKLKNVCRKSKPVGLDRYENSAEHSWHVCLSALVLREFADDSINIDRVIKMLLVHDLGEIDAGDTIVYRRDTPENQAKEMAGVERILNLLPVGKKADYLELWIEFETGETADAKYARAIDRLPPLLQNLHNGGLTWKENNITPEMVLSLNRRIEYGSRDLWDFVEKRLKEAFAEGLLSG